MTAFDKKKVKKTKEQLLRERVEQEREAARLMQCPIKFGMGASAIKAIKKAVKGR